MNVYTVTQYQMGYLHAITVHHATNDSEAYRLHVASAELPFCDQQDRILTTLKRENDQLSTIDASWTSMYTKTEIKKIG